MIFWIFGVINEDKSLTNIFKNIFSCNFIHNTIRICYQHFKLINIFVLYVITVKILHWYFTQIWYACSNINWFIKIYYTFFIAIASLRNFFSLFGLNDPFQYGFLVVTIFTSTLLIGFSIDLLNIALLLNLWFSFLTLLPSFFTSLLKYVLCSTYGFLNWFFLWILIFCNYFLIVTLNLNKVLSFNAKFIFYFIF